MKPKMEIERLELILLMEYSLELKKMLEASSLSLEEQEHDNLNQIEKITRRLSNFLDDAELSLFTIEEA